MKPFQCLICFAAFESNEALDIHHERFHLNSTKKGKTYMKLHPVVPEGTKDPDGPDGPERPDLELDEVNQLLQAHLNSRKRRKVYPPAAKPANTRRSVYLHITSLSFALIMLL